jgi:CDP-4-dehydro-6-deoxyglucose reductase, E3
MNAPAIRDDVPFTVVGKQRRTPVIIELTLCPVTEGINYLPGQYVLIDDTEYRRPPRSYSIANAPRPDSTIDLLVTLVAGGEVSPWLHHELQVGQHVLISGPYGRFIQDPEDDRPHLYLAGGSGLAPVRALIESLLHRACHPPATLLFSARAPHDLIDDALLGAWDRADPAFRYVRTLTRVAGPPPTGHVADVLPALVHGLDEYLMYIAGSPEFVGSCAAAARRHGARPEHIFTEEFFTDPLPWGSAVSADGGVSDGANLYQDR